MSMLITLKVHFRGILEANGSCAKKQTLASQGFVKMIGHMNPKTNPIRVLPYGFVIAVQL